MENKKILLLGILIVLLVATFSNVSAFCNLRGYIYNTSAVRTVADSANVTCIHSGGNDTQVPASIPGDGYLVSYGGPFDDCDDVCDGGGYIEAANSTFSLSGENSTSCGSITECYLHVTMTGLSVPTITIVTPTSDYTYVTGTTNYDATCTADEGSVEEVIFTSNHTGSSVNYSYIDAQVTNPSGNTYRYAVPSLAAGTYLVYEWFCNQTNSQSDTDGPQGITINQATGEVYAYVNNLRDNASIDNGSSIWLNATLQSGTGDIKLYKGGVLINQGSSPLSNYTLFNSVGLFNISAIYDGNSNYSSSIETWYVNVTADTNPPYFTVIPANASINYGVSLNVDFDAVDDEDHFDSFSVNDSRFSVGASTGTLTNATSLASGVYIMNVSINDTEGNYNWTLYQVTVNSINPPISITILPGDSVEYLTQTNASGSGCPSQIVCNFYRNDSSVTNPDVQTLEIGTYGYKYNTTGNVNYSSYSVSDTLSVTAKTTACDVLFNESSPITYPATFTVWSNCDTTPTLYRNGTNIANNSEQALGAGTYNFTVIRNDQSNYTNYYDEENFVVEQATPALSYYLNGITSNAIVTYPNIINASASTDTGSLVIYRNATDVTSENNLDIGLAAGYYRYDFNVTGNENYSNVEQTLYATVNQATGIVYTYLNATQSNFTIEIGTYADLNGTIIAPGSGEIKLYSNNTLINQGANSISNLTQFSSYGTFNVTTFYDGNNNYTGDYETWYVIVEDTTPPEFIDISNISVYDNESVYYDIEASDVSGIDCFEVNDSDFSIYCSGILQNATILSVGMHWLNITVNDTYGNENYSVIYVNVTAYPDFNSPYFITIPVNASINYGISLNVDFDAVDDEGNFDSFDVNDSRFSINSTGGLVNSTSLAVGVYIMNVSINDSSGNYNWTLYQVTVNQITPTLNIVITPSNSETYPTATTADASGCPSQITCNLYRNDTGSVSDPDVVTLGVGVYNYTSNTTGNTNYTSASYSETLTISQNTSNCSVYFNTSSPVTYPNTFIVYHNCDSSFTLYRNGSSISNGAEQTLGAGVYNFTVIRDDQANYSNYYDEETFVVSQATSEVAAYLNASRANISTYNGTYINLSAELLTGSGDIKLYKNGSLINQGTGLIYNNTLFDSISLFNISAVYEENTNYSSDIETWWVNVTEAPDLTDPTINFVDNTTAEGNYTQNYIEAKVSASDNAGINLVEIFLYNSTSLVSSQTSGSENYSYNFTSLGDEIYYLNATANDTSDNQDSTETRTIILDNTAPYFTDFDNQTVYDNESLNYDINATDDGVGVDCFSVNDTTNFTIDCDGILQNATTLTYRVYVINVTVNDTLGNLNYSALEINMSIAICGNGIVEGIEECDDGNNVSGDGCSSTCQIEVPPRRGGGGRAPPVEVEVYPFNISSIVVTLFQGESTTESFIITNNLEEKMTVKIDFDDIEEFVKMPYKTIVLAAGEFKIVEFEITVPEDQRPGVYFGEIEIEGDEIKEIVRIVINVKEREALFDIATNMITSLVPPGTNAKAKISMINLGRGDLDVTLYYSIIDFANNTLVSKTETIRVETSKAGGTLNLERSLRLPSDATDKNYMFYAKVMYEESVAASANVFATSEPENWVPVIIIILLVTIIFIIKLLPFKMMHKSTQ